MGRVCRTNDKLTVQGSMYLFFILCSLILSGCGGDHSSSAENPDTVSFRWNIIQPDADGRDGAISKASVWDKCEDIAFVQGIVYEEQTKYEVVRSGIFSCTENEGKIDGVKPNTEFRIVLVGLDTQENVIYRGQSNSTYTILPGETSKIGDNQEDIIDVYPIRPAAPQVHTNAGRMMVEWNKLDEEALISTYALYMDTVEINVSTTANNGAEEIITATVSPLKAGLEYCFSVSAVDAFGNISIPSAATCDSIARSYTKLDADGNDLRADASAWEMVRDEETGLVWEIKKDTNAATDDRSMRKLFWYTEGTAYKDSLNSANFGGYSNWRLPNPKELFSLVETEVGHRGGSLLAIDRSYFQDIVDPTISGGLHARFWTSTDLAQWTEATFAVKYGDGGMIFAADRDEEQATVRAVLGTGIPLSPDYDDFIDNEDGTITDNSTRLMWQKNTFTGVDGQTLTWEQAVMKIDELNAQRFANQNDWRMPKIKELVSIMDYDRGVRPYIHDDWFDNVNPVFEDKAILWSSTISRRQYNSNEPGHEYVYISKADSGGIYENWDKVKPSEGNACFNRWNSHPYYVRAVRSMEKVDVVID